MEDSKSRQHRRVSALLGGDREGCPVKESPKCLKEALSPISVRLINNIGDIKPICSCHGAATALLCMDKINGGELIVLNTTQREKFFNPTE